MSIFERISSLIGRSSPDPVTSADVGIDQHKERLSESVAAALNYEFWNFDDTDFLAVFLKWRGDRTISSGMLQGLSGDTAQRHLSHRNGYMREFCLRVLIERNHRSSMKSVIRMLNDYVPGNRKLAATANTWIAELPMADVIALLPELLALQNQSRADVGQILNSVNVRLSVAENSEFLLAGITHSDPKIRSSCWRIANPLFQWDAWEKVQRAIASNDVVINQSVVSDIPTLDDEQLLQLLAYLPRIKAMQLRREVYLRMARRKLVDSRSLSLQALWDKSFSIRWMARLWLSGERDVLFSEYRSRLESESSVRKKIVALEGFRALKDSLAIPLILPALIHQHPSVRRAALYAVCELDKANVQMYLNRCIGDASISVQKTCFAIATKEVCYFSTEVLQNICRKTFEDADFFVSLIHYAQDIGGWTGLSIASLTQIASGATQKAIANSLLSFLRGWIRSLLYKLASDDEFSRIDQWLTAGKLTELGQLGRELKFILDIEKSRRTP